MIRVVAPGRSWAWIAVACVVCSATVSAAPSARGKRAAAAPANVHRIAKGSRPNVVVILADDLGYTDLSVFGSEIHTPNIDRLAATGVILTNYYSAPLCAPTRAMLLSGTDHHRSGEGLMSRAVEGAPGYEGHLNDRVVTLATRLRDAGYHTYMAGKWHLGEARDLQPAARGFERSFTMLQGAADHFELKPSPGLPNVTYVDDGKPVTSLPPDFYSARSYTDKMIGYLKAQPRDGRPFFAYMAYTSPHWPIQALDEDLAKQKGRYDAGYEVLRQERFAAWKKLGFEANTTYMPNLPPKYRPWNSLTPSEQAKSSRTMEAYAAMVERLDTEIGRLLNYLQQTGQLANTIVIFQSDNGAEAGGPDAPDTPLDRIGRKGSGVSIGPEWAAAAGAPHSLMKYFANQGGVNVPAIVSAPKLGVPIGRRSGSLVVTYDVAPTLIELAGVDPAASPRPGALTITGHSFLPLLQGNLAYRVHSAEEPLGWEHDGEASIRVGDWKLAWFDPDKSAGGRPARQQPGARPAAPPTRPAPPTRAMLEQGGPAGDPVGKGGPWRLYNLRADPAELYDLSAQHPDIVKRLKQAWLDYADRNQIIVKRGASD